MLEEIGGFLLDESEDQPASAAEKSNKCGYKDRKLEHRLKKYESILKSSENINRTASFGQVSLVASFQSSIRSAYWNSFVQVSVCWKLWFGQQHIL